MDTIVNEITAKKAEEEKHLKAAYYYLGKEYEKLLLAGRAPAIPELDYLLGKAAEFRTNVQRLEAQLQAPAAEPVAQPEPAPVNKFCTNCGAALEPGARFCTSCGANQTAQG